MQSAMWSFEETRKIYRNKSSKEIDEISIKIDEAIKDGLFSITGVGSLSDNTLHDLRELGYDAQNDIFEGNNYYWISWITIDTFTNKTNGKISKLNNEMDEQIHQIKQTLKKQKRNRIVYSFIGAIIGYCIWKIIFYLLVLIL